MAAPKPYKPGALNNPLPGTSSTGNTSGMPKVSTPAQRRAYSNNQGPDNPQVDPNPGRHPVQPSRTPKPVMIKGGRDSTAANAAAKAAAKAAAAKARSKKTPATGATTTAQPSVTPTTIDSTPISGSPEDQALASINNPGYGAVAGGGTGLAGQFDPAAYGKSMAGMQFDPQIGQVAARIKGIINALPGSLESLHTAFANLSARAAAPPTQAPLGGNTGTTSEAYAQQTAGNANDAAAAAARAGASREADWNSRIRMQSGAQVNDLRGQLGGLTQARSDAQVGYTNQGIKTKSDLVSQAIANINSIRAGNDAEAMVRGTLVGQGLKNDAQSLANSGTALAQGYYGPQADQALAQGGQTIVKNDLAIAAAKKNLKAIVGNPTTLKDALAAGKTDAVNSLTSLIIPNTGIAQNTDPTTGQTTIKILGDPNTWVENGVKQIMRTLPGTIRKNARAFANTIVQQAIGSAHGSSGNGWTQDKNGKWVRPK